MKANRLIDTIKEYVRKLSDDDLWYLHQRLIQRIGSDVAEATELIQDCDDMDYWLTQAKSANEFFEMIDVIDQGIQNEVKRRFAGEKEKIRS